MKTTPAEQKAESEINHPDLDWKPLFKPRDQVLKETNDEVALKLNSPSLAELSNDLTSDDSDEAQNDEIYSEESSDDVSEV